jgi:hypothetical protein
MDALSAGEDESSLDRDAAEDGDAPTPPRSRPRRRRGQDEAQGRQGRVQGEAKSKRRPPRAGFAGSLHARSTATRARRGYYQPAQPTSPALFLGDGYGLVPARPFFVPGAVEARLEPLGRPARRARRPARLRRHAGSASWPADVTEALRALDRRGASGVRIVTRLAGAGRPRPPHGRQGEARLLLGQVDGRAAWLQVWRHRDGEGFVVERLQGGAREAWSIPSALGRTRPAVDGDAGAWQAPFAWAFGDEPLGARGLHRRALHAGPVRAGPSCASRARPTPARAGPSRSSSSSWTS